MLEKKIGHEGGRNDSLNGQIIPVRNSKYWASLSIIRKMSLLHVVNWVYLQE